MHTLRTEPIELSPAFELVTASLHEPSDRGKSIGHSPISIVDVDVRCIVLIARGGDGGDVMLRFMHFDGDERGRGVSVGRMVVAHVVHVAGTPSSVWIP
jgi:hypothetical protein